MTDRTLPHLYEKLRECKARAQGPDLGERTIGAALAAYYAETIRQLTATERFVPDCARTIPIVLDSEIHRCECGAVLSSDGMCATCADIPLKALQVPEDRMIHPNDHRE